MELNLINCLAMLANAEGPMSLSQGLLTMEDGRTADITALHQEANALIDALRKAEAVLSQQQDNPALAQDILRQGYFGHALVRARTALNQADQTCCFCDEKAVVGVPDPGQAVAMVYYCSNHKNRML